VNNIKMINRTDEAGDELPWEIEGLAVVKAHIDRELEIRVPGEPWGQGILSGWDVEGILVRYKIADMTGDEPKYSGESCLVLPEHLSWANLINSAP